MASVTVAGVGEPFQYVVDGDRPDRNRAVVLNDTLPAGVSFVSATTDQGVGADPDRQCRCRDVRQLAAAMAALTIVVNPTASPGSTLAQLPLAHRPGDLDRQ